MAYDMGYLRAASIRTWTFKSRWRMPRRGYELNADDLYLLHWHELPPRSTVAPRGKSRWMELWKALALTASLGPCLPGEQEQLAEGDAKKASRLRERPHCSRRRTFAGWLPNGCPVEFGLSNFFFFDPHNRV